MEARRAALARKGGSAPAVARAERASRCRTAQRAPTGTGGPPAATHAQAVPAILATATAHATASPVCAAATGSLAGPLARFRALSAATAVCVAATATATRRPSADATSTPRRAFGLAPRATAAPPISVRRHAPSVAQHSTVRRVLARVTAFRKTPPARATLATAAAIATRSSSWECACRAQFPTSTAQTVTSRASARTVRFATKARQVTGLVRVVLAGPARTATSHALAVSRHRALITAAAMP